jgi:hexosaminidase
MSARGGRAALCPVLAGVALALLLIRPADGQAAPANGMGLLPAPLRIEAAPGRAPVVLPDGSAILTPARNPQALETARYLASLVHTTRGLSFVPRTARARGPAIVLKVKRGLGPEAYELDAGSGRVTITASTSAGLFYGAVTLWQLISADGGQGAVSLAPVHIEDSPRFAWRGLMLDSARHFWSPIEVERLIDQMALHKLNVLHWHLTDDQGWRIQIRKYPRLTEVGAWRTPIAGSPDAGSGRYGGFYTQAQIREIVAYAAGRHVTITPELDMPGHAVSAILAYPQLGAGAPPPARVQAEWGGFPYVLNLDDATIGFVEDVLTEVMELFPGRYVHVGGDEAVKERWNSSPAVQARMTAEGITDVTAAQSWFTSKIGAFLQAHGRRLVGWDEILQGGGLPADAVVMSWHGADGAVAAATAGHDAVLAAAPVLYFDNRQGDGPDEPPGRGLLVTLHDVYAFEPAPPSMPDAAKAHILGLQGNVWTEHVRTDAQLEAMAFPRLAAVAETGWSAPDRKDWRSFVRRLPSELARDAALGVRADRAALAVRIDADLGADPDQALVSLASQAADAGELRYTVDGSAPAAGSTLYGGAFPAPLGAQVRASLFIDGRPVASAERRLERSQLLRRASQELKLCNDRLSLNLEGAAPDPRPAYLVNPLDACWIWPAAPLDGVRSVAVGFGRLPFMFGLDEAHNTVIVHPPREPSGELEVHQDSCLNEPIAVAAVPPGAVGSHGQVRLGLPVRSGRHDLCFTFTAESFDPVLALDWVRLDPTGEADR